LAVFVVSVELRWRIFTKNSSFLQNKKNKNKEYKKNKNKEDQNKEDQHKAA